MRLATGAVVRKPPKNDPAGSEARLLSSRYGDLFVIRVAAIGFNLRVAMVAAVAESVRVCLMTNNGREREGFCMEINADALFGRAPAWPVDDRGVSAGWRTAEAAAALMRCRS